MILRTRKALQLECKSHILYIFCTSWYYTWMETPIVIIFSEDSQCWRFNCSTWKIHSNERSFSLKVASRNKQSRRYWIPRTKTTRFLVSPCSKRCIFGGYQSVSATSVRNSSSFAEARPWRADSYNGHYLYSATSRKLLKEDKQR